MRHSRPRFKGLVLDLSRKQPEGYVRETEQINAVKSQHQQRHKFQPAKWTHPNGHPRCRLCGHEERVGGFCEPQLDLAKPSIGYYPPSQPKQEPEKHTIQPPPQDDATVATVAAVLASGLVGAALIDALFPLLRPWQVTREALQAAAGLANRGTATRPNALPGTVVDDTVKGVRDAEVFFRASYLCHAAKRITASIKAGSSLREAIKIESRYYLMHEKARKQRLAAIKQIRQAATLYGQKTPEGTLLGWYLDPLLHNESECAAANGHNFYLEKGTVIGYPGSVHFGCGCTAGPPIPGAKMVDEAVASVIRLAPDGPPKFKLKKSFTEGK